MPRDTTAPATFTESLAAAREPVIPHGAVARIPSSAMVASAARYGNSKMPRVYHGVEAWQNEAYRHYRICGEARYAANFFGHALSRATLSTARKVDGKEEKLVDAESSTILDEMFAGKDGQPQMLEAIGKHLTIAGECWIVGRTVADPNDPDLEDYAGEDLWEVVSVKEMQVTGKKWMIRHEGYQPIELSDDDYVIRVWIPDPEARTKADSPFRSLLPVLAEIEYLTRHIWQQITSRLAGAGLLLMPQEVDFPPPPPVNGKPFVGNKAQAFMATLGQNMLAGLNPDSPAGTIPLVSMMPGQWIQYVKHLTFWSPMDEKVMEMRQDALHRFASGFELPNEQTEGMSSNGGTGGGNSNGVSHWGAWQIEEQTIKMFLEPMLNLVDNALTIAYLRPLLDDRDPANFADYVTHDTSALRLRPDRSKEAFEAWDRIQISTKRLLGEIGFEEGDMPDKEEFKLRLLQKVATGSATPEQVAAALSVFDVLVPSGAPQAPRETRPDPSLEDHPEPKAAPEMPAPALPEAAALIPTLSALVFRALERTGNRIRQDSGVKPEGIRAYDMHTVVACNGKADTYLNDAWSTAPIVLEGICNVPQTVANLNAYTRMLLATQQPHTNELLREFWTKLS